MNKLVSTIKAVLAFWRGQIERQKFLEAGGCEFCGLGVGECEVCEFCGFHPMECDCEDFSPSHLVARSRLRRGKAPDLQADSADRRAVANVTGA